jgi:hypothetical protein
VWSGLTPSASRQRRFATGQRQRSQTCSRGVSMVSCGSLQTRQGQWRDSALTTDTTRRACQETLGRWPHRPST